MRKVVPISFVLAIGAVGATLAHGQGTKPSCAIAPPGQNTPPYCVSVSAIPPAIPGLQGVAGQTRRALRGTGPTHCVPRSFRFRETVRAHNPIASIRLLLDGHTIGTSHGSTISVQVPIAGLRRGTHKLTVKARDQAGLSSSRTFRFTACGGARRPSFTG